MLNLQIENNKDKFDSRIIKAFENDIKITEESSIENLYKDIKYCKFDNHIIGRGGNHIFVNRKDLDYRVLIIS